MPHHLPKPAILFVSWMLLASTSGAAIARDTQCLQLKSMEQQLLEDLPIPVDDVTTLVGLSVSCNIREIQFVKHLALSADDLEHGVEARKQQQYLKLNCSNEGFASLGWTSRDYIYDQDLELVMSLHATPAMCE